MVDNLIPLTGMELRPFTPSFWMPDGQEFAEVDVPTFFLRIPTFAMRDKLAAVLFQRGLIPTTQSQSRAILIDALYDIYEEAEADDHAAFLEQYWTKAEVHEEMVQGWQIREVQRLFDLGIGVKPTAERPMEQEPLPQAPYTMREQARNARLVTDALDRSDRYRSYQSRFMVQKEEEEALLTRLFISHWDNCGDVESERDDLDRLTIGCIERLRGWFQDQGADNAWDEIKRQVNSLFGASGGLEKNSGSPLDTNSSQNGLQTSSGDLETSDGSSTTSSITPTPSGKSPGTSGSSRNSPSARKGKRPAASKKRGRTGARS